jgi:hypothetical protein
MEPWYLFHDLQCKNLHKSPRKPTVERISSALGAVVRVGGPPYRRTEVPWLVAALAAAPWRGAGSASGSPGGDAGYGTEANGPGPACAASVVIAIVAACTLTGGCPAIG